MSVNCQYLIFSICSLKSKFSAKYFVIFLDKHINIQVEWAVREFPMTTQSIWPISTGKITIIMLPEKLLKN